MTFRELAVAVLKQSPVPLSWTEIWEAAEKGGLVMLLESNGKTPQDTLSVLLYTRSKGKSPLFIRSGSNPVRFSLAPQMPSLFPDEPKPKKGTAPHKADGIHSFTILDSTEKVLASFGNKKPMHYKEITKIALEQKWLVSHGATPEASVYAQVLTDIARREKNRKPRRFTAHGQGYIGLAAWEAKGIRFDAERHNNAVLDKYLKYIHTMDPKKFEALVGQLFEAMSFKTDVTSYAGDGGVDVRGELTTECGVVLRVAVQVKRWKENVQSQYIQGLRGSLGKNEHGMFITASDFTKGAKEDAADPKYAAPPITLINGKQLVEMLARYEIGIRHENVDILELDTDSLES